MLTLLYPQRRAISEAEVIRWALDLLIDEAIDNATRECGAQSDRDIEAIMSAVLPLNVRESIDLLIDSGNAEFARSLSRS